MPEPVGATIKVFCPDAIAGQPSRCAGVGSPNCSRNHDDTAGWNRSSTFNESVHTLSIDRVPCPTNSFQFPQIKVFDSDSSIHVSQEVFCTKVYIEIACILTDCKLSCS